MVSYYTEDISFQFKEKRLTSRWLKFVAESETKRLGDIAVIFCSDHYILDVNMKYLQHDYFTDIITFDYCDGTCFRVTCSSPSIPSGKMPRSTARSSLTN